MSRLPPLEANVAVMLDRLEPPPLSPGFADKVISAALDTPVAPLPRLRRPGWRRRMALAVIVGSVLSVAAAATVVPEAFREIPVIGEIVDWLDPLSKPDGAAQGAKLRVIVDPEPPSGKADIASEPPVVESHVLSEKEPIRQVGETVPMPSVPTDKETVRTDLRRARDRDPAAMPLPRRALPNPVASRPAGDGALPLTADEELPRRALTAEPEPDRVAEKRESTEQVRTPERTSALDTMPDAAPNTGDARRLQREGRAKTPVRRDRADVPRRNTPQPRVRPRGP